MPPVLPATRILFGVHDRMNALIAMDSMFEPDSVAELKVECARLIAMLEANVSLCIGAHHLSHYR